MILPDQPGLAHPHLIVGAGKDTNIYLVDRDNMGKFETDGNNNNQIVQELQASAWRRVALPAGILERLCLLLGLWRSRKGLYDQQRAAIDDSGVEDPGDIWA